MTDPVTSRSEETGAIPAVMSVLAELDQTQAKLQSEFPGWRIWYVYRPGAVSWAARREPVLNTQSVEDLRAAILKIVASDDRAASKVLQDISAPLASHRGKYCDPEDTLDLPSVIADEFTEDDLSPASTEMPRTLLPCEIDLCADHASCYAGWLINVRQT